MRVCGPPIREGILGFPPGASSGPVHGCELVPLGEAVAPEATRSAIRRSASSEPFGRCSTQGGEYPNPHTALGHAPRHLPVAAPSAKGATDHKMHSGDAEVAPRRELFPPSRAGGRAPFGVGDSALTAATAARTSTDGGEAGHGTVGMSHGTVLLLLGSEGEPSLPEIESEPIGLGPKAWRSREVAFLWRDQ